MSANGSNLMFAATRNSRLHRFENKLNHYDMLFDSLDNIFGMIKDCSRINSVVK